MEDPARTNPCTHEQNFIEAGVQRLVLSHEFVGLSICDSAKVSAGISAATAQFNVP